MENILLIDIGNTAAKWAWSSNALSINSVPHIECDFSHLLDTHLNKLERPQRIIVANVAGPKKADALAQWASRHWKLIPDFVNAKKSAVGVINGYRNPAQLGVDRWLTLLAARHHYADAVCIVDCGTAITIDTMDQFGHHCGGLILPGFRLMQESLFEKTNIPESRNLTPDGLWAKDSHSAIASAALYATVALVEKVLSESYRTMATEPKLIMTGSDADRLVDVIDSQFTLAPDLVMQGLRCLAEEKA